MQRILAWGLAITSIVAMCIAGVAEASVVITGTRVIFSGTEREVSVKLDNNGTYPALVQTWIDAGDIHASPNNTSVPFVIMPPVFRVEPGRGQTLRLLYTQEPLPQDRESVFYLNVLEIPPTPKTEADASMLQLAFRSRIKIFFRPQGLDSEGALEAPKQVVWRMVKDEKGAYGIEGSNPTPYHVNIAQIRVGSGAQSKESQDGGMIVPGGSRVFPVKGLAAKSVGPAELDYVFVNDFGTATTGNAQLSAQ